MSTHALNRVLTALAWAGIFVAGFLTIAHFMNIQVPCGVGKGGCAQVASDPRSQWFGIPVALFGFAGYSLLAILAAIRTYPSVDRIKPVVKVGLLVSGVGAAVSIYLQYVSFVIIGAKCDWCISSAAIMILTLVFMGLLAQRDDIESLPGNPIDKVTYLASAVLALGALGALIGVQIGKTRAPGEVIAANPGIELVVPNEAYFIGPKDAPVTIVEFADFYCGACRTTSPIIRDFQRKNPDTVRLAFRNFPLFEKKGHELSLSAALCSEYAAEKGKYWEFIDKMFEGEVTNFGSLDQILNVLARIGLDPEEARKRLGESDDKLLDPVTKSLKLGEANGINETPSFIIFAKGENPVLARNSNVMNVLMSSPIKEHVLGTKK
ncbi:MAG: vitamin K epoxide reductase family protein [Fimbriimonadaceae bacterium]|nr:vitamin K epoxide reductase family protein [Fimbriimonadaceae bacterium]